MAKPRSKSVVAVPAARAADAAWSVYLIRARGGVLYAGITTDVAQRAAMHAAGRGAKFLRGRGPLRVVFRRELGEHGLALRVEHRLKRLAKAEKEALVRARPSRAKLLALLPQAQNGAKGRRIRAKRTRAPRRARERTSERAKPSSLSTDAANAG